MDKPKGAIPEAKSTKGQILRVKNHAQRKLAEFLHGDQKYKEEFDEMRKAIVHFYWELRPHLVELEMNNGKDYSSIHQLENRPKTFDSWRDVEPEDWDFYREKFKELNKALYDLGVTKISLKKKTQAYGYEFLNGLDHNLAKEEDPGWRRLKENFKNIRRLLRQDTDIVGLIYGGNRTGKTTLSIQLTRIVQKGNNEGDLPKKHFIFNDDDFRNAMNDGERYQANHVDEMSLLFHKRDGMNTEQKERNKMMKTYAVKNMFMIGCDNNFYNIDGEFLSDKIDFVIHVPKRGKFEFYSKSKVAKFSKGDDDKPETPDPDITGRFPNLDPSNGKTDPVWKTYKEVEDKKLEVAKEDDSGEIDYEKEIERVIENEESYKKELEGRDPIIKWRKIRAESDQDISRDDAKYIKGEAEERLGY